MPTLVAAGERDGLGTGVGTDTDRAVNWGALSAMEARGGGDLWGEGWGREAEDERGEWALWGGEEGLEEGQGGAGAGEGGEMGGCPWTEGSAAEEPVLLRKRFGFSSVLWC